MKFTSLKKHFIYTKGQRLGILVLFSVIISFQLYYFFVGFNAYETPNNESSQWLALQKVIDFEKQQNLNYVPKIYPFNPNFITDFNK